MIICILIFIASIVLYITNLFAMGVVGLLTLVLLVLGRCIEPNEALNCFSNRTVIIMMSMYVVSAGFCRSRFINSMSVFTAKLTRNSFRITYFCYIVLTAILTNLINSPLISFSIVLPLVLEMCNKYHISRSKVIFSIGIVSIACCCILPFGAAIQQAEICNSFLEAYGFNENFMAMDLFKGRWPFIIIIPIWAYTFGYKIAPDKPVLSTSTIDFTANYNSNLASQKNSLFSDIAGLVVFLGVVVYFIMNANLIPSWTVCLLGAVLTITCRVISVDDAIKVLPLNLAGMLIGSIAMGNALLYTGAGDIIGKYIASLVARFDNNYFLGTVFFVSSYLMTQFMPNQAVISVLIPICLLLCKNINATPIGLMTIITSGAMTAFMSPMATPAVPSIMGAGGYDLKSLIKQGWSVSIIIGTIYITYVMSIMPAY